jgi:hypothetical protein
VIICLTILIYLVMEIVIVAVVVGLFEVGVGYMVVDMAVEVVRLVSSLNL